MIIDNRTVKVTESISRLIAANGFINNYIEVHFTDSKVTIFASLMLFAPIIKSKSIATASTDGKNILINDKIFSSLRSSEQNAVVLHEVLHLALLHLFRTNNRNPEVGNIAADIVVNDLIDLNTSFKLPEGAIRDKSFRKKSVDTSMSN